MNIYWKQKQKKLFPLINQKFNNFLIFFPYLWLVPPLSWWEIGVIFPHYFSSSFVGDCAPLEYPIWLVLHCAKVNCLWRKITPFVEFTVFFSFFFPLGLIAQGRKSPAVRADPLGLVLKSSVSFIYPFVVIECSFIILFIFYVQWKISNVKLLF